MVTIVVTCEIDSCSKSEAPSLTFLFLWHQFRHALVSMSDQCVQPFTEENLHCVHNFVCVCVNELKYKMSAYSKVSFTLAVNLLLYSKHFQQKTTVSACNVFKPHIRVWKWFHNRDENFFRTEHSISVLCTVKQTMAARTTQIFDIAWSHVYDHQNHCSNNFFAQFVRQTINMKTCHISLE